MIARADGRAVRGRERFRAGPLGAQWPAHSQRQSRSHRCGNGDGARPLRVDHWKSERRARANFLHANGRLVRLALCRHVRHPAGVSISRAIKKPIAINCGLRERLADLRELSD